MDVNPRTVRGLFEMCAGVGVERQTLELPFSDDERGRFAGRAPVDWDTFVRLLDHLFTLLGHDTERARELGRQVHRVPSHGFLVAVARHVGSLRHLYEAGRWSATGNFPHLELRIHHRRGEVEITGIVPAPHRPCVPLHYIMQGAMLELPRLLALDSASIVASEVHGERSFTVLGLPAERSLLGRAIRRVDAAVHAQETQEVYESQRRELTQAVHRLEQSAGELRGVLDALPDPVFLLRATNIVWANRAAATLLAVGSIAELVGQPFDALVHPLDLARFEAAEENDVSRDGSEPSTPRARFESVRLQTHQGALVEIELSTRQTVSFEGGPAILLVARDVSERMRMQQRLVMVDRLASIGTLAAGVAHEVNNPLSYILWNLDVVGRTLGPRTALSEAAHDALVIVREGIDRVRTVVRDLRALARPDENTLEPLDVHAVLETTLSLTASELSSRAHVIRAYDADLPRVHANGARLGQIFLNLILNAISSMESQPLESSTLTVRTSRVAPGNAQLAVDVSDTGAGIPEETAARIFDPFFTTKPFGRGTGLGLTISPTYRQRDRRRAPPPRDLGRRDDVPPAPALRPLSARARWRKRSSSRSRTPRSALPGIARDSPLVS